VYNQEVYSAVADKLNFIDQAIANTPPKKEKEEKPKQEKPKEQPKKQEKKKDVDEDEEEDDAPAAPKAKHPLEALPRATFVIDDWYFTFTSCLVEGLLMLATGSANTPTRRRAKLPCRGSGRTASSTSTASGRSTTSITRNSRRPS